MAIIKELLDSLAKNSDSTSHVLLRERANNALQNFDAQYWESSDWKYLNIWPALQEKYHYNLKEELRGKDISNYTIPHLPANQIVFINGKFSKKHSQIISSKQNLIIESLLEAEQQHPALFNKYFHQNKQFKTNFFANLNTAFFTDGLFIFIPQNTILKEPIQIINLVDNAKQLMIEPKIALILAKNSRAILIENYHSESSTKTLINQTTEINLQPQAILHHFLIQQESPPTTRINSLMLNQDQDSAYHSHQAIFQAGINKTFTNIALQGTNSQTTLNELFLLQNNEQVDHQVLIEHQAPHCHSQQTFTGIINNQSQLTINSQVHITKQAPQSQTKQVIKNLLLTDTAQVNFKPQLEIYADDVRCSHHAHTGQLDEEALLYMRSRGIAEEKAKKILLHAFTKTTLQHIEPCPLRKILCDNIQNHLEKMLKSQ
jgi:Fe-S cluster assembly protein SufD